MSRNRNCRNRERMGQVEIYSDDSFRAALQQKAGIAFEQFAVVAVNAGNKKVILLAGTTLDSGNDAGAISVSDFVGDDAQSEGPPLAQGAGKKIGAIVQLAGGGNDALAGRLGDVFGGWSVVQNGRNRSRRESHVGRDRLKRDCIPVRRRCGFVLTHMGRHPPQINVLAGAATMLRLGCPIIYTAREKTVVIQNQEINERIAQNGW